MKHEKTACLLFLFVFLLGQPSWGKNAEVQNRACDVRVLAQDGGVGGGLISCTSTQKGRVEMKVRGGTGRAMRVQDFGTFRDKTPFVLLHLYCGPRDVLMDAATKEARSQGLRTAAVSIDRKMNDGVDLDDPGAWEELDKQAEEGEFDYARGGFPCGSFSRVRWSGLPGPPPVRSAEEIYGLSSNSKMQEEADRGTRGQPTPPS